MQGMTNREFRTWNAWLDEQWNEPTKTDYYLMQIAGHVAHVMSKKSWSLDKYQIKFCSPNQKTKSGRSAAEVTASAKAAWATRGAISREGKDGLQR